MKRFLIAGAIAAMLLVVLWPRRGGNTKPRDVPEETRTAAAAASSSNPAAKAPDELATPSVQSDAVTTGHDDQLEKAARYYNETYNVPVAFYGLVVDQDSNALPNVRVDLEVLEQCHDGSGEVKGTVTPLQRQTGADGRFEVTGLKGRYVTVGRLSSEGYEPEPMRKTYGAQSGDFVNPMVFRMWSTDIHEQLITGDRQFKIVPDGRRYAIDLSHGTIAEGERGDLVVWMKRTESVKFPRKYAWSCEMVGAAAGLEPENNHDSPMYCAPLGEYTNAFSCRQEADTWGWTDMSLDNRFYVRLRNGQEYGRLSLDFWTTYRDWTTYRKDPAFGLIHLSYAINPSGSRLLR